MKLKLLLWIAVSMLFFTGCKKSWLDVNKNPNELPTTISNYVFVGALYTTAYNYWGDNGTGNRSNEIGA